MHSCDNPRCVNPKHLSIGSGLDNILDMRAKHREARGSGHGIAKLTEEMVALIKKRLARGEAQTSIAARFGVTQTCISHINLGKTWTHVPTPT